MSNNDSLKVKMKKTGIMITAFALFTLIESLLDIVDKTCYICYIWGVNLHLWETMNSTFTILLSFLLIGGSSLYSANAICDSVGEINNEIIGQEPTTRIYQVCLDEEVTDYYENIAE